VTEDRAHLSRCEVEHAPATRVIDERPLRGSSDEIRKLPSVSDQRVIRARSHRIVHFGCLFQEAAKLYLLNFAFSASTTFGGAKGEASPPIEAIWRTRVAVIGLTGEEAGRKTVRSSGAMAPFMPAICIS